MRQLSLLFVALFSAHWACGQIAIIQDVDGYTNLREKPSIHAPVIHQIQEGEVFYYFASETKDSSHWYWVSVPKNKLSIHTQAGEGCCITGYVHKSRVKDLVELPEAHPDSIGVQYFISPFEQGQHTLDSVGYDGFNMIDGLYYWGADWGTYPKTQVDSIHITIHGVTRKIPRLFHLDLYNVNTSYIHIYRRRDRYFISQANSDGAGYYDLVWAVKHNGEVLQRLVGHPY